MVPEKHDALLHRADEYARNRVICGVHYQSDVEASRQVALLLFGNLLGNARFRAELLSAKAEARIALGLRGKDPQ